MIARVHVFAILTIGILGLLRNDAAEFEPSPVIADITLEWSTHERHAMGSDNWQLAWADDDHQYGAWGDGSGFGKVNRAFAGLGYGRIEGDWKDYRGYNVWGWNDPENPPPITALTGARRHGAGGGRIT